MTPTTNLRATLNEAKTILANRNIASIMLVQTLSTFLAWLWWPYKSLFILELGASTETLGLMIMVETLGGIIFQVPGGVLADRYGRKKVVMASAILGFGSPLLYLLAQDWIQLFPALILASTSALARGATNALIAESLPPKRRGTGFASITFVQKIPNVFTGIVGGLIMDRLGVIQGVRLVLLGVLLVSLLRLAVYWRYLEETLDPEDRPKRAPTLSLRALGELLHMPRNVWVLTAVAGLSALSIRMVFSFTVPYVVNVIGLSKTEYGAISTMVSLVSLLLTLPGGVISDRIGRKQTVVVSRVLASLSTLGVPLSRGFFSLAAFRVAGSIGSGLGGTFMRVQGGPVWKALVADLTTPQERARVMGLMGTFVSIISTPGSYLGGYLYDNLSPQSTFYVSFLLNTLGTLLIVALLHPEERES